MVSFVGKHYKTVCSVHFCSSSRSFRENSIFKFQISKSKSRSQSTIFAMTVRWQMSKSTKDYYIFFDSSCRFRDINILNFCPSKSITKSRVQFSQSCNSVVSVIPTFSAIFNLSEMWTFTVNDLKKFIKKTVHFSCRHRSMAKCQFH